MPIVVPFQWQYRSLVFGAGTNVGLMKAELESLPPIDTSDLPRDRLDGSFTALDVARTRSVPLDFEIPNVGDGQYYATRELWRRTFAPVQDQALPLSGLQPDWSAARRLYSRPRKRPQPEDNESSIALSSWSVVLDAPDPFWYDDTPTAVAGAGTITIPNAGNWPGPGSTPSVTTLTISTACTLTETSGGNIVFAGAGPWTIDLATHQVTGGNGYADIVQPAIWFLISPGGTSVSVTAGTVSASTRSSWL